MRIGDIPQTNVSSGLPHREHCGVTKQENREWKISVLVFGHIAAVNCTL